MSAQHLLQKLNLPSPAGFTERTDRDFQALGPADISTALGMMDSDQAAILLAKHQRTEPNRDTRERIMHQLARHAWVSIFDMWSRGEYRRKSASLERMPTLARAAWQEFTSKELDAMRRAEACGLSYEAWYKQGYKDIYLTMLSKLEERLRKAEADFEHRVYDEQ